MSKEIYVPEGEQGDEVVKRIIPQLYAMAESKRRGGRGG